MMRLPVVATEEDFDKHLPSGVWAEAALEICRRHGISAGELRRAPSSDHPVFLVGDQFVVKIYRPFRDGYRREKGALEFVGGKTLFRVPEIVADGELGGFKYILMTQLPGRPVTRADWLKVPEKRQSEFVVELAAGLKSLHALDPPPPACCWREFVRDRAESFVERQIAGGVNRQIIESLPAYIEDNLKLVPVDERATAFLHGDVHFGNLRVRESDGISSGWEISGLFDFSDSLRGFHEYDFLAVGLLMIQGQRQVQREFFRAYGYAESDLDETLRRRLMMLTMLYETSDLRRYALRLKPEAVDFSLEELERAIWSFAG